jgi:hypothetical protein
MIQSQDLPGEWGTRQVIVQLTGGGTLRGFLVSINENGVATQENRDTSPVFVPWQRVGLIRLSEGEG